MKKLALLGLAILVVGCGPKAPLHKGKPASHWQEQLADPDPSVRRQAARSLAALEAKQAVPGLITALKDKDAGVRASAAEALWSIGPAAKEAVPDLIVALKDRSPDVRLNSAGALGEMGAEAKDAVPALNACLKDKDENVHHAAKKALEKIQRALKKL
jgi:HEAT repeat protein